MTTGEKIGICAGVLLAAALAFATYGWLHEHDARLKAESQTAVQQKSIDAARAAATRTASDLKARLAALEAQKQRPATPQQFVLDASKLIPNLPQAVTVQTLPAQVVKRPDGKIETTQPESQVVIPQADLGSFRDYALGCQEASAKLDACTATNVSLQKQLTLTGQQRDEWKTAAAGGSKWHRALAAAKWLAVGAAVGYVAAHR